MQDKQIKTGLFITFEGGEGSGKSTQISSLERWLRAEYKALEIVVTREPGGTAQAEEIRHILVNGKADKITPQTEALLMIAARTENVDKVIRPALSRNAIVICDRFADSSRVYQAFAVGQDSEQIDVIHEFGFGNLHPDITFFLDIPPEIGLKRAYKRISDAQDTNTPEEDRFETKGHDFHHKVRQGYHRLADQFKDRMIIIDARHDEEQVARCIRGHVKNILDQRS